MTSWDLAGWGLLALVGIFFSALYSGLETGIYTINRVRVLVRADRGERAAVRLRRELDHPNRVLSTLLLGNNAANYLSTFGVAAILNGIGFERSSAIALNAAVVIPLLFVFGETLPKDLFRTFTDRWTYGMSGVLTMSRWVFTMTGLLSIVQITGRLTGRLVGSGPEAAASAREHISGLIKEGVSSGVLSEAQTTLADRALAMRGRTVATEMIPWPHVVTVPVNAQRQQREMLFGRRNFTRLPVMDRSGRVVGILSSLDALLAPNEPTERLMNDPFTLPAETPVPDALRTMRLARQAMAVAIDATTGRPCGIVTLKDLVEPVTGELAAW